MLHFITEYKRLNNRTPTERDIARILHMTVPAVRKELKTLLNEGYIQLKNEGHVQTIEVKE